MICRDLSSVERRTLDGVHAYIAEHGHLPNNAQLARSLGLHVKTIWRQLQTLRAKGRLVKTPPGTHGIEPIDEVARICRDINRLQIDDQVRVYRHLENAGVVAWA